MVKTAQEVVRGSGCSAEGEAGTDRMVEELTNFGQDAKSGEAYCLGKHDCRIGKRVVFEMVEP